MAGSTNTDKAATNNLKGLEFYRQWKLDEAVEAFKDAAALDANNPEYHLNLARAYARSGKYHEAIKALGEYIHAETDEKLASRYERLFSTALDEVEENTIAGMQRLDLSLPLVGKAIQMWLEYRIAIGRQQLRIPKPEIWAAALTYAVCKVNLLELTREQVVAAFDVKDRSLKEKYDDLVETLDLLPGDYRYFTGEENPLDELVEAAEQLNKIYQDFREG
ncbi:MAG: tetratricopeptide repeat protein [Chloroflexi bacterium]|nr:tetratricopeptide repeat protein [Chloroflexota bacterium]MBP8054806.1 tetratricopeptide repeat protein [Chloroflexota bacterium]